MACPSSKVRHRSKRIAFGVLKAIGDPNLNVYRCRQCNGWHLGNSQNPIRMSDKIGWLLEQHAKRHPK
jgi:hypothetical protein